MQLFRSMASPNDHGLATACPVTLLFVRRGSSLDGRDKLQGGRNRGKRGGGPHYFQRGYKTFAEDVVTAVVAFTDVSAQTSAEMFPYTRLRGREKGVGSSASIAIAGRLQETTGFVYCELEPGHGYVCGGAIATALNVVPMPDKIIFCSAQTMQLWLSMGEPFGGVTASNNSEISPQKPH